MLLFIFLDKNGFKKADLEELAKMVVIFLQK